MKWYNNHKNEWKEIIETVAREYNRLNIMIEKDIVQTKILYRISNSGFPFAFKGGTSLSKGYKIIDRFSEDIDLSLTIKPTETDKKNIKEMIMSMADELELYLNNTSEIQTRFNYNKYIFKYDSLFGNEMGEVMVETNFFIGSYPISNVKIHNYVSDFVNANKIKLPIDFKESNFSMNVQSLERTFIDKVFAICDYKINNMQKRDSRHLYDIAKMMPKIVFNKDFNKLVGLVRQDRMKLKNNPSADLKYYIPVLIKEIIDSRFYETDYNQLTTKLLYEEYSYEKAIKEGIEKLVNMDAFKYKE